MNFSQQIAEAARTLYLTGDISQAVSIVEKVLQHPSIKAQPAEHIEALTFLADLYANIGEYEKSHRYIEVVEAIDVCGVSNALVSGHLERIYAVKKNIDAMMSPEMENNANTKEGKRSLLHERITRTTEIEGLFTTSIESLSPQHRITLATSISERLLPYYEQFSKQEGWGTPSLFYDVLDAMWKSLTGTPVSEHQINAWQEQCYCVTPDFDSFANHLTEEAVAAGAVLYELLSCYQCPTVQQTRLVMSIIIDLAVGWGYEHLRVSVPEFRNINTQILRDPGYVQRRVLQDDFVSTEYNMLKSDIGILNQTQDLTAEFLEQFRQQAQQHGELMFHQVLTCFNISVV